MSYFKGKKIAIAGGSGFVGINLIARLTKLGAIVKASIHDKRPLLEFDGVEYIPDLDLTNSDCCETLVSNSDFVFMCAANSSGAQVMDKTPLVHLTPNLIMNAKILEASYKHDIKKFCFISSNTVYPVSDKAMKEEDLNFKFFEKYFVVGWMKVFSEIMCSMYSQKILNPMNILIVRPGNLFGPFDKYSWEESKVIAALIRKSIERMDPLEVWGDGMDIKDFLYIDDFIDGLITVFEKFKGSETVNIASGNPVSIKEVLTDILKASNYNDAKIIFNKGKPSMIPFRMIDISKVQKKYRWSPNTTIFQGLVQTINWYKKTFVKEDVD